MTPDLLEIGRQHASTMVLAAAAFGVVAATVSPGARLAWALTVASAVVALTAAVDWSWRGLLGGDALSDATPLVTDGVGVFALPLVVLCALAALLAGASGGREWAPRVTPSALALLGIAGGGWCAALLVGDLLSAFAAMEAAWLATTALAALSGEQHRGALNGALRMLSMGGVAAAFFLLGIGLVGAGVGGLRFDALPSAHIAIPVLTGIGIVLLMIALAIKAGLAPFHAWLGAAAGAGDVASLAIGALNCVGALAMLTRVAAYALPAPALAESAGVALATIGVVSLATGSLLGIGAGDLRRLTFYAGMAQGGCVLIAAALGSAAGFSAAFIQLAALAAAAIILLGGSAMLNVRTLDALDGLGRRAPVTSVVVTLGAMSLMGAPLTIGFLGRWRLIEAGVGADWSWTAVAAIAATLAGVFYGGRIIQRLYFRRPSRAFAVNRDPWRMALAPALALAAFVVLLGLEPSGLLAAADAAAAMVMRGGI